LDNESESKISYKSSEESSKKRHSRDSSDSSSPERKRRRINLKPLITKEKVLDNSNDSDYILKFNLSEIWKQNGCDTKEQLTKYDCFKHFV